MGGRERERQRDRECYWEISGGLGINPHLILAQSLDKIKAFVGQCIAEYRFLISSEKQPVTGTLFHVTSNNIPF